MGGGCIVTLRAAHDRASRCAGLARGGDGATDEWEAVAATRGLAQPVTQAALPSGCTQSSGVLPLTVLPLSK